MRRVQPSNLSAQPPFMKAAIVMLSCMLQMRMSTTAVSRSCGIVEAPHLLE